MILRLEELDSINVGEAAASSIQKEAMRISKIDNIRVEPYRVKDENPLQTVECGIDVIFINAEMPRQPGKPIAMEQSEIGEAIQALFETNYLNRGEIFPIQLR